MEDFAPGWFVLYTRPNHEKKVDEQLRKLDFDSFLPTVKTLKTWCDRKKYVDVPLFPSYVFVKLRNLQGYYSSLHIDGVLNYIRTGNRIARVCESIVNDIRVVVTNGKDVEISAERFRNGDCLVINDGPFAGFKCELIQYRGNQKLLVRIDDLKQSILLNLPAGILAPVSEAYVV